MITLSNERVKWPTAFQCSPKLPRFQTNGLSHRIDWSILSLALSYSLHSQLKSTSSKKVVEHGGPKFCEWLCQIWYCSIHTRQGLFYWHGSKSIPAWISNYIHYKVWDKITYPFPNFNGATVEVWEWINNFILHFTMYVITYPCSD